MPRYDYRCDVCGDEREVIHRMADSPDIRCEACNELMRRVIRAAVLVTDTNNPLRSMGRTLGRPMETRADVRAAEADGIVMANHHDRDIANRKRSRAPGEELRQVLADEDRPYVVRSG